MDRLTPDPAHLRRSYELGELVETNAPAEPLPLFTAWFADAVSAGLTEPNAMVLATASGAGVPHARTVLLKGYGADGFRLFTNHTSQKGQDLLANPQASLLFPWHPLQRQVIVTGAVERLDEAENAAYFRSRPRGSQLGAWASHQSSVVSSRAEIAERFTEVAARWPETDTVPLPEFWGGYLVIPHTVEFWQGRPDRLHDRLRYRRAADGWDLERLAP